MKLALSLILTAVSSVALAKDAAASEAPKPSVVQLDETRYQIGQVEFDRKSREIRFPCKVNMTSGLLEYLVVHENGKLHESLLSTTTSATDLNLAFTLLRYQKSPELYLLPTTDGKSDDFPQVPDDIKAAARITIDLEWTENGKVRRISANDWIQHEVKTTAMPPGPWVYGGSLLADGQFAAEFNGDLIAIFVIGFPLITYPGNDNTDDTVWVPFLKRVPTEGTNVTLIIAPYQTSASPKP